MTTLISFYAISSKATPCTLMKLTEFYICQYQSPMWSIKTEKKYGFRLNDVLENSLHFVAIDLLLKEPL